MAGSQASRQLCLAASQGPPGAPSAPARPLHSNRVLPATGRKPEGCRSQRHPSSAKPEGSSEGEQSRYTTSIDPLKHFMVSFVVRVSYS